MDNIKLGKYLHYKGKEYILTWDQYQDLLAGKDITIVDTLKTK